MDIDSCGSRLLANLHALERVPLTLAMVLGLASCAEKDNPANPNLLAKQVSGLWCLAIPRIT